MMLMYFLYYCGAGVAFWLFSFARWPMTWRPLTDAWAGGRRTATLCGRDVPAAVLVAAICVVLILAWPFFAVTKKS